MQWEPSEAEDVFIKSPQWLEEQKCQSREPSKETVPGIQVRDDGGFDYTLDSNDKEKNGKIHL